MIGNPYAAPLTDSAVVPRRNDFTDIPFKQLKKLRNDSNSIRALMVLLFLPGTFGVLGASVELANSKGDPKVAVGLAVFIFMGVAAIGLMKRSQWGRVVAIITSILMLVLFPIGTIVGALALGALGSKQLFGPARLDHRLLEAEFKYRKKHKVD